MEQILAVALLTGRAALAAVLVAAGSAKLADVESFAVTLTALGISAHRQPVARRLGVALPLMELGIGFALASGAAPEAVDIAALVLTIAFSAAVVVALSRHLQVTCRCFGALSESQFSRRGLARSLALMALAAILVWQSHAADQLLVSAVGFRLIVVGGYGILALATLQAAKTMELARERRAE